MKHLLILLYLAIPILASAQQLTDYNKKGDAAMNRHDYSDAQMWYAEGVSQCDIYSIVQLTKIWRADEEIRPGMRVVMNKSLNCLNVKANNNDTTAIKQLIIFYAEGIGAQKSEDLAGHWRDKLKELTTIKSVNVDVPKANEQTPQTQQQPLNKPNEVSAKHEPIPQHFFLGYSFSGQAPFGLTFGRVGVLGWYTRLRTNGSFKDHTNECTDSGEFSVPLSGDPAYRFTNKKKVNCFAITAGIAARFTDMLYMTAGVGYGKRDLLYEYITIDKSNINNQNSYWCKDTDSSYNGAAVEADLMLRFGSFYISGGCNTINFQYIDVNAGIGLFF